MQNEFFFMILVIAGFFVSCRHNFAPKQESQNKHLAGEISGNIPEFSWYAMTDAELMKQIAIESKGQYKYFPFNSLPTSTVQLMVDEIDSYARQITPTNMAKVPKPRAVVFLNDEIQAYAPSYPVCIPQQFRPINASFNVLSGDESPINVLYFNDNSVVIPESYTAADFAAGAVNCMRFDVAPSNWDLEAFISHYNQSYTSVKLGCHLSKEQQMLVAPRRVWPENLSPLMEPCGGSVSSGTYIRFRAQVNTIFVHSGLLQNMSKIAVYGILAHELSHYYRAHVRAFGGFRDYFYLQSPANDLQKPQPTTLYPDIQKALLEASEYIYIEPTHGTQLNENLWSFVRNQLPKNILAKLCSPTSRYDFDCHTQRGRILRLVDDLLQTNFDWDTLNFTFPPEAVRKKYTALEELTLETLSKIILTPINENDKNYIDSLVPELLKKFFDPVRNFSDLNAWLIAANDNLKNRLPSLMNKPFVDAAKLGLGLYTIEEEADALALEIWAQMGRSKEEAALPWIEILTLRQQHQADFQDSRTNTMKECLDMRKNYWRDEVSGLSSPVLLATLKDPHHGECFRLYNSDRQWDAHQYGEAKSLYSPSDLSVSDEDWSKMQNNLKLYR